MRKKSLIRLIALIGVAVIALTALAPAF